MHSMNWRYAHRAAVVSAVLLAGCTGGPREAAEVENGIAVDVPGWRAERTVSVGGKDAGEDTQLFTVTSVAEDPQGRFYVLNSGDRRIVAFDSTGAYLHTIGKEGRGPGEFVAPRTLAAVGSDALYVIDLVQRRISRFRRSDGGFLSDLPLSSSPVLVPRDVRATLSGVVAVEFQPGPTAAGGGRVKPRIARVDTVSGELSSADVVELDTTPRLENSTKSGTGSRVVVTSAPFAPKPVWALDSRGKVVFGNGAEFVVWRAEGPRVDVAFRAQGTRQPVTERDKEEYFENPMAQAMRGQIQFPRTKPFFTGLMVDPDDRVWLEVPSANPGRVWEVREPSGRRLGTVTLPRKAYLRAVGRNTLYVLTRDEDDVETLHRYRLHRPQGANTSTRAAFDRRPNPVQTPGPARRASGA